MLSLLRRRRRSETEKMRPDENSMKLDVGIVMLQRCSENVIRATREYLVKAVKDEVTKPYVTGRNQLS